MKLELFKPFKPIGLEESVNYSIQYTDHKTDYGFVEKELIVSGNRVIQSTVGGRSVAFSFEQPIEYACWTKFEDIFGICVLFKDCFLKVLLDNGQQYETKLPFTRCSIFPIENGLLIEKLNDHSHNDSNRFFYMKHPLQVLALVDFGRYNVQIVKILGNQIITSTDPGEYQLWFIKVNYKTELCDIINGGQDTMQTRQSMSKSGSLLSLCRYQVEQDYEDSYKFSEIECALELKQHFSFNSQVATNIFIANDHQNRHVIFFFFQEFKQVFGYSTDGEQVITLEALDCAAVKVTRKDALDVAVLTNNNELQIWFGYSSTLPFQIEYPMPLVSIQHPTFHSMNLTSKNGNTIRLNLPTIEFSQLLAKCLECIRLTVDPLIYERFLYLTIVNKKRLSETRLFATVLFSFLPLNEYKCDSSSEIVDAFVESRSLVDIKYSLDVCQVLYSLHLLYEEFKLSRCMHRYLEWMAQLLQNLSSFLGWTNWVEYKGPVIQYQLETEATFKTVPSIYDWMHSVMNGMQIWYSEIDLYKFGSCLDHTLAVTELLATQPINIEIINRFVTSELLDDLSVDVSLIILQILHQFKSNPPLGLSDQVYRLLSRQDLIKQPIKVKPSKSTETVLLDREQIKERIMTKTVIQETRDDPLSYNQVTKLRFNKDNRISLLKKCFDLSSLLEIQLEIAPHSTEAEISAAQQQALTFGSDRRFASTLGRALATFSTSNRTINDKIHLDPIEIGARLKPLNSLIKLDMNLLPADILDWPEFHSGVATGLTLDCLDSSDPSWLIYNQPTEMNSGHAGVLLGLGLKGYLKNILSWQLFEYFQEKNNLVKIAGILGLCGSFLGTMDASISRILCVHVPFLVGSIESELDPLVQAAGTIGVGMLYLQTGHKRMSEILLGEFNNFATRNDEYVELDAICAGFGVGMINLGLGKKAEKGPVSIVEKLLKFVHGPATGTIPNANIKFNVDSTAPAALIAIGLVYLKTMDRNVASMIDIPDTEKLLEYIRPDILMLRICSQFLILFDLIAPSREWIDNVIPDFIKSGTSDVLVRAHQSLVAGLCLCIGLKFAGSLNASAFDCLNEIFDYFREQATGSCNSFIQKLNRSNAKMCLNVVASAIAMVMAGSGNHALFTKLNELAKSQDLKYGDHMAIHMSLGLLFLGGGAWTLGNSNQGIAFLLGSFYPIYPVHVQDNRAHLQATRHLWVLAAEKRCLITVDVDSQEICSVPIELEMVDCVDPLNNNIVGSALVESCLKVELMTPCLLPHREFIKSARINSPRYWSKQIDSDCIYVKRKTGHLTYEQDPKGHKSILARSFSASKLYQDRTDLLCSKFLSSEYLKAFAARLCNSSVSDLNEQQAANFHLSLLYECIVTDKMDMAGHLIELFRDCKRFQRGEQIEFRERINLLNAFYTRIKRENNVFVLGLAQFLSQEPASLLFQGFDSITVEKEALQDLIDTFN